MYISESGLITKRKIYTYEGEVSLRDKNINEIGLTKYRRNHVAMIYQNFNLIPYLSPVENIEVALDITDNKVDRSRAAILEILDAVGISGKKARLRASVLSGGEQQRVAITRALATGSEVLIADEPTGNLDVYASDQVISIFRNLAHENGKCIIMVTHNQRLAAEADAWYEIDKKKKQIVKHE